MIPPHQTPSADLLERIRRYIAAHLQGSSDIIEEAKRKLPRPVPRPFEGERERRGIARDPGVHEEPLVCGVTLPRPRVGLDGILSRLKSKLDKPKETFSERLLRLIRERGRDEVEVYQKAGVDRKLFSKMRRKDYRPKAKTLYAFIIVLQLTLDDAVDLLASAGYAFSSASRLDLAVKFCVEKGIGDLDEVNNALYELGMETLP